MSIKKIGLVILAMSSISAFAAEYRCGFYADKTGQGGNIPEDMKSNGSLFGSETTEFTLSKSIGNSTYLGQAWVGPKTNGLHDIQLFIYKMVNGKQVLKALSQSPGLDAKSQAVNAGIYDDDGADVGIMCMLK